MIQQVARFSLISIALLSFYLPGYSQYAPPPPPAGPALCAWPSVPLRTYPGRDAGELLEAIFFGEQITILGPRELVQEEKRYYVLIQTAEGKQGWVHEHLFVPGGRLGVMIDYAKVYKRPGAVATITDMVLSPGEIVIVAEQSGDWTHASSRERRKDGWIEGTERKVSLEQRDVELATLHDQALLERNPKLLQEKLNALSAMAAREGSPLAALWTDAELNAYAYSAPAPSVSPAASSTRSYNPSQPTSPDWSNARYSSPQEPAQTFTQYAPPPGLAPATTRSALPAETYLPAPVQPAREPAFEPADTYSGGSPAQVFSESGLIAAIEDSREPGMFVAYHKTLPPGTLIRLELPVGGFIELTVVGILPPQSQASLGITPKAYKVFFGMGGPANATFFYQRP